MNPECDLNASLRTTLLARLLNLLPSQFEVLIYELGVPASLLKTESQAIKTIDVLNYCAQPGNERLLDRLKQEVDLAQTHDHGGFYNAVPGPPSIGEGFVGREESMRSIARHLCNSDTSMRWVVLQASGGFGKTRLAVEFARCYQAHFPGGVFWVDAAHPETRVEQFYNLLKQLHPWIAPLEELLQRNSIEEELREALRERRGLKLWIVDNVIEEMPNGSPDDPLRWCPVDRDIAGLALSRGGVLIPQGGAVQNITLRSLTEDAALQLLGSVSGLDISHGEGTAKSLVKLVGCFPLAVEVLAYELRAGGITPADLLCELKEEAEVSESLDELIVDLRKFIPAQHNLQGIAETFRGSYERLGESKLQNLVRTLAHLGPAPIPKPLFRGLLPSETPRGERRLLRSLSQRHFLMEDHSDASTQRFVGRMHAVLASYLRTKDKDNSDLTAAWCTLSEAVLGADLHNKQNWGLVEDCAPHALAMWDRLASPKEEDVRVLLHVGEWYNLQGRYSDELTLEQRCYRRLKASYSEDHPLALKVANNLANTLHDQGQPEKARTHLEETLTRTCRVLSDAHMESPEALMTLSNLARVLMTEGTIQRAECIHRYVLDARQRELGRKHPEVLVSMSNLAGTLYPKGVRLLKGERFEEGSRALKEAQRLYQDALNVRKETHPSDHPEIYRTMSNLALLTKMLATTTVEIATVQSLQEQVLAFNRDVFGINNPNTLTAQSNLASTLYRRGEYTRAGVLHEEVLKARLALFGEQHINTIYSMSCVATVFKKLERFEEAKRLYTKALRYGKAAWKAEDARLIALRKNIAELKVRSSTLEE